MIFQCRYWKYFCKAMFNLSIAWNAFRN